jgi:hypothetical protein
MRRGTIARIECVFYEHFGGARHYAAHGADEFDGDGSFDDAGQSFLDGFNGQRGSYGQLGSCLREFCADCNTRYYFQWRANPLQYKEYFAGVVALAVFA